ncbi:DUF695 domain-containing protein [Elizabethkingia ursingii]|jgi:hypothetical protein|uniref:DUF695 domain-containing protein n=1 Tax=Elizabethkingia ursingii TaxID=1756150 RepID=A0AAJ3TQQ7_9FLAO|nr:DUF695 domain-containing protein [Elizabethkingia ursingii]AQX10564.1 hypothetical protein BBD34_18865 [Elizabethkingia ursingii]OPB80530.1 hypothetical protein BAY32_16055 [Elizabethkingia ursingii]
MSSWFNYRFHDEEGNVVFLRGKENIDEHIASGKYSQRLEIAYRFKGNEKTNLPDETILGKLDNLEHKFEKEFAKEGKAILALSFTGKNRRVWYVYTSDVHSAIVAINMAANVETELDIIYDTDENWEFYKNFYSKK